MQVTGDMLELKKNEIYTAEMESFASDSAGVCRIGGRAVFVPRAIPGETWRVRIVKANRTAVWGRGEKLLTPSPHRIEPACPVFGKCGGCDALRRIGGLDLQADGILGSPATEGYRSKAIYNFAPGPRCGFYRSRSHEVVETPRCLLQPESFQHTADALLHWMKRRNISAYDETTGQGILRHLLLRSDDNGLIACIVAAGELPDDPVPALRAAVPGLTGVLLCRNDRRGNTVLSGDLRPLWGRSVLYQTLCGVTFELSPLTFFQVNSAQAEQLYRLAGEYAQPAGKVVLDLYCGAGSIGLSAARDARRIVGNDIVPAAVENARENAARNGVSHAEYICGDASFTAQTLAAEGLHPDVVITDPPRRGMDEAVLGALVQMAPERIVYVSCDPGTLARDLRRLSDRGYAAVQCMAVDMFPRTSHVETVCLLSKLSEAKHHISVQVDMDELDLTAAESKATYVEIQEWVQEKYEFHVSHLNIAQVKRKHGIIERENYNKPKSPDSRQPGCPEEKVKAIEAALKHFQML